MFLAMAWPYRVRPATGIVKKHPRLYAHLLRAFRNLRKDLRTLVDTLEALERGGFYGRVWHWKGTSRS